MWIAFIFQYLWDTKQLDLKYSDSKVSCELLSFFSIFGIQNNEMQKDSQNMLVVNCFHFSVSLGYKTTQKDINSYLAELWIAFIFQYLWDTKQLLPSIITGPICCELLSFFSIFGIQNNRWNSRAYLFSVVNCFHFSVSLGYKTTLTTMQNRYPVLWIAFIFQYLWDTKQRIKLKAILNKGCELLSFFSIFGIQNNSFDYLQKWNRVVNCFHFSVSLGYKTTLHQSKC